MVNGYKGSDWGHRMVGVSGSDAESVGSDCGGRGCDDREGTCGCGSYCMDSCALTEGGRGSQGTTRCHRLAPVARDVALNWGTDGGLYLEKGFDSSWEQPCCPWRRQRLADGASFASCHCSSSLSVCEGSLTLADGVSASFYECCGLHWGSCSSSASCGPCPYSSVS